MGAGWSPFDSGPVSSATGGLAQRGYGAGIVNEGRVAQVEKSRLATEARARSSAEADFVAQEDDDVDVYIKSLARAASSREATRSQGTYSAMGGKRNTTMKSKTRTPDRAPPVGGASSGWGGTGVGSG